MSRTEQDAEWHIEKHEWLESLQSVQRAHGASFCIELLEYLAEHVSVSGIGELRSSLNTPYRNTISPEQQPPYPGDVAVEQRLENIIRWNAIAMVLRANDAATGVGGHIATYASAATLLEVGMNHIFRNKSAQYGGDIVNVQPHSAPGVYARAFAEGRLTVTQLQNYRRELQSGGGLSSYPHPRRMPELWPCPTASMGLSTAMSVYLARFAKYLENRGLKPRNGGKVWCFIGDGEADEPEVLGTIQIAAREKLDNLVLVVNCNLQRLDGPVRGNGKIIQELERTFRGADWNVLKVVWGSAWDPLFAADSDSILQQRMDDALDGDYQMYSVLSGEDVRKHWVRGDERLAELMQSLNDEQIRTISRGGHDHHKVFAAYHQALQADGQPTVILAKTIKGFTMGSEGEGRNTVHQKKTMSDDERIACAQRLGIPITKEAACAAEFYLPDDTSPEMEYLLAAREGLGGFQPTRSAVCDTLPAPTLEALDPFLQGTPRQMSTTMVMVRLLAKLLRDKEIGKYLVPIVPDEARTFGMDGLFRQVGIYSADGQQYEPVDADTLMPYRESKTGQILQEGICEAGAIASFLAAGTAYSHFSVPTIPFYFFYSMFGFQRVGDFIWAGGDALCRGFLIGGTAGRTTLNGEGLQHQDGHSHVLAGTVPSVVSYDPCFGFELAIIVREGIRRMYENHEAVTYYITVYNENHSMPAMPSAAADGILKGLYRFKTSSIDAPAKQRVQLFGSGAIMQQVLLAQQQLESRGVAADVWSATSYTELYRDALQSENDDAGTAYLTEVLAGVEGPIIAVSDYMSTLPLAISKWLPGGSLTALGTDGFGLSESRASLRQHFGVDAASICEAAVTALRIGN